MTSPTITLSQIENQTGPDFLGFVVNWRLMNIRVQESDLKAASIAPVSATTCLPYQLPAKHCVALLKHG